MTSQEGCTRCGRVEFDGVVRDVNLACVPEAEVGDFVLVHAGVAIGRVRESEAQQTLALLRQMAAMAREEPREAPQ
jgi:hydrogenase expression/formation protein HypC